MTLKALFGDSAMRLLRTRWSDANALAQEMFAMITSEAPINLDGPIQVTNNSQQPAIQITNTNPTVTPDGNTWPAATQTTNQAPASDTTQKDKATTPTKPTAQQQVVFRGTITGKVAGLVYTVNIIPSGLVQVTQLQGDPNDVIPNGTSVIVYKDSKGYFMQVPIWLAT